MKIAYLGSMGAVKPAEHMDKAVKEAIRVLEAQGARVGVIDFEHSGPIFDLIGKISLGGATGSSLVVNYSDKLDQMTPYYGKHFIEKGRNPRPLPSTIGPGGSFQGTP